MPTCIVRGYNTLRFEWSWSLHLCEEWSGALGRVFLIGSLLVLNSESSIVYRVIVYKVGSGDQFEPRMKPRSCRVVDSFRLKGCAFSPVVPTAQFLGLSVEARPSHAFPYLSLQAAFAAPESLAPTPDK